MEKTITYYDPDLDAEVTDVLRTYSEEEQQQNEVNASNASLVFSPKFIPIYPELLDRFTPTEALIFGFIDFFKSNASNRFYFTNEQIGKIVRCSEDTASRAISKLEKGGLIKTSRKVRAGGGQVRFVTDISYKSDSTIPTSLTRQKLQTNDNKIKDNKINIDKGDKSFGIVDNFKPSCHEEQKLVEWSEFLGKENMRYLLSRYKQGYFWALEWAMGIMKETDLSEVANKGAYFNVLVEGKLKEHGTKQN